MDRIKESARDYKDCERILKSELIKRFDKAIDIKISTYRKNCMRGEGADMHRDQGAWIALEEIVRPLLFNIRDKLKKECGERE